VTESVLKISLCWFLTGHPTQPTDERLPLVPWRSEFVEAMDDRAEGFGLKPVEPSADV
jgi:hypothetical protein